MAAPLPPEVRRALPALLVARFGVNTSFRVIYPFLPVIARGLGVSLATAGLVVAARELAGLVGPAVGRHVDAGHERAWLVGGTAACGLGIVVAGLPGGVATFALGLVAHAVAKAGNDLALGTWIARHTPFAARGRVTGLVETTWALAFLVDAPVAGALVATWGWPAALLAPGALLLATAPALGRRLDPDRPPVVVDRGPLPAQVRWLVAAVTVLMAALLALLSVYGAWLEDRFGLGPAGIGVATVALGLGELGGSLATAALADRWGKRRAVLAGVLVASPLLLALSWAGSLPVALVLIAVVVLGTELAFVSSLPLVAELAPAARGRAMGALVGTTTVGRAVAAAGATAAYDALGFGWAAVGAAALAVLAGGLVAVGVREPGTEPTLTTW